MGEICVMGERVKDVYVMGEICEKCLCDEGYM